jgi:acetyl-CoA C-acetyltransferase
MEDPHRIPVIVGAAQITDAASQPPDGRAPLPFLAEVARAAAEDTGANARALLAALDSLVVVRLYSDSNPRFATPFGRMANPPWSLAQQLGAQPRECAYPAAGGDSPQTLVTRACARIARGESSAALIVGAEPMRSELAARRAGLQLDWSASAPFAPDTLGDLPNYFKPVEVDHGLRAPSAMYGLIGQAVRVAAGQSIDEYRDASAKLFEGFAAVARDNPLATRRAGYGAHEIAAVTERNPMVGFPFTKLMTASAFVDQAAAVIVCSEAKADEWGVPKARRVYLHGAAAAHDTWFVTDRPDLARSTAARLTSERALSLAGRTLADMELLDIYSCFPSAVQVVCKELGLAHDDPRALTVTGGLAFFGGPGNNYSLHAVAEMVARLRQRSRAFGMVLANGGLLTKESIGVYSAQRASGQWLREEQEPIQPQIDAQPKVPFTESPSGEAVVENYTVMHLKGVPDRGILLGRLVASGERFVANFESDLALLQSLETQDCIGLRGEVQRRNDLNLFRPAGCVATPHGVRSGVPGTGP